MKRISGFLIWAAVFCMISIGLKAQCLAGTGEVIGGTPNYVNLNLYYTYTPTDPMVMKNAFQEASKLLFNSTNGQVKLGTIRASSNSAFQNKADVWVNNGAGGAYANVGSLGTPGAHITLFQDRHRWTNQDGPLGTEIGQFGIIHEFGHYGFNLHDEYNTGAYSGATCVDSTSQVGCIMDGGTTVHPRHHRTEFCTAAGGGLTSSHILSPNTPQQALRGHSCWEEITAYTGSEYGINLSAPTSVTTSNPAGAGNIAWVNIGDRLRYVLALDRSYSMSVDNKEPLAKQAASLFVDLCKKNVGESIGVVSFSNSAISDYPIQEVTAAPDTKSAAINAINAVQLENMTALGDGLRRSLNEITGNGTVPPDASAAEAIVLLSDGVHNYGAESPAAVLPDLRARGVRVFTIGLGTPSSAVYPLDEATLLDISRQTGAQYEHAQSATDLPSIYSDYAAEIRGMDAFPEASGSLEREATAAHKILVDGYTKEETFLLHWPFGDNAFQLQLKRPDGTLVLPRTRGVEIVQKKNYVFYRIQNPKPGTWTMVVKAAGKVPREKKIGYKVQAFAKAPGLSVKVAPRHGFQKQNQPVVLRAFVNAGGVPVAKAAVTGTVSLPNGRGVAIRFYDDGQYKETGDEKANDGVYTAVWRNNEYPGSYQVKLQIKAINAVTATPDELERRWQPAPLKPFIRQAKTSFMVGKTEVKAPESEKGR